MKVLSLLQPWASLVVTGAKVIETRSWNTKYRGPLLIHASAKFTKEQDRLAFEFSRVLSDSRIYHCHRGAIIGQVDLVGTETTEKILANLPESMFWGKEREQAFGDYSPNRYGWYLSNPVEFPVIIPAKGQLGIWEYEMPEKLGFNLKGGGHASFEGMPDLKTIEALEKMMEVAKQSKLF